MSLKYFERVIYYCATFIVAISFLSEDAKSCTKLRRFLSLIKMFLRAIFGTLTFLEFPVRLSS